MYKKENVSLVSWFYKDGDIMIIVSDTISLNVLVIHYPLILLSPLLFTRMEFEPNIAFAGEPICGKNDG